MRSLQDDNRGNEKWKQALGIISEDISDASGIPLSTVQENLQRRYKIPAENNRGRHPLRIGAAGEESGIDFSGIISRIERYYKRQGHTKDDGGSISWGTQ